jgi:hypothetical protein
MGALIRASHAGSARLERALFPYAPAALMANPLCRDDTVDGPGADITQLTMNKHARTMSNLGTAGVPATQS